MTALSSRSHTRHLLPFKEIAINEIANETIGGSHTRATAPSVRSWRLPACHHSAAHSERHHEPDAASFLLDTDALPTPVEGDTAARGKRLPLAIVLANDSGLALELVHPRLAGLRVERLLGRPPVDSH
eukprot:CAMPEP_0119365800 /NCGR_PEP_ID=MMETSP1334-20130426/12704_1 /TAXON_ID=127549 /ORGANISM="Calcidiscus leptoporus, Strain RCC1130" /LENGTH=127 /DNA_ID=CAMNT_0007381853 /DNA_START=44 /DNA_END=424 /DNA_ORIENTATION=-